jgi:Ca-activated chloride channel family protein
VRPVIADLGDVPSEGGSVNLYLGDLEVNAPPAVLLELIVPPRPAGDYRLCQVLLAYEDPRSGRTPKIRQDVVVRYSEDPAALAIRPEAKVMNVLERVSAFRLQTRALEQAATGDLAGATAKLRMAATRLLDMGEPELARTALREADNLQSQGQMSATGSKEMRYATRQLTQERSDP